MGEVQPIRSSDEPWINAEALGKHYGLTAERIRQLARAGHIPYRKMGFGPRKFYVFQLSAVELARQEAS